MANNEFYSFENKQQTSYMLAAGIIISGFLFCGCGMTLLVSWGTFHPTLFTILTIITGIYFACGVPVYALASNSVEKDKRKAYLGVLAIIFLFFSGFTYLEGIKENQEKNNTQF